MATVLATQKQNLIDDTTTSLDSTWSSTKIAEEFKIASSITNGVGGTYSVDAIGAPDYANVESINRMPALTSTWTVERDGYVSITFTCRSTGASANAYDVRVNNVVVLAGSGISNGVGDGIVAGIIRVSAGDVISFTKQQSVNYISSTCYFVPPVDSLPIRSGIDYSLTEQDTGQKWIDGKTIYQQTYEFVYENQDAPGVIPSSWPARSRNTLAVRGDIDRLIGNAELIGNHTGTSYTSGTALNSNGVELADWYVQYYEDSLPQNELRLLVFYSNQNLWDRFIGITAYCTVKYTKK